MLNYNKGDLNYYKLCITNKKHDISSLNIIFIIVTTLIAIFNIIAYNATLEINQITVTTLFLNLILIKGILTTSKNIKNEKEKLRYYIQQHDNALKNINSIRYTTEKRKIKMKQLKW